MHSNANQVGTVSLFLMLFTLTKCNKVDNRLLSAI